MKRFLSLFLVVAMVLSFALTSFAEEPVGDPAPEPVVTDPEPDPAPADDPTEPPKDDPTEPPKDDPTEPPKDDPTEPPKDDPTEPPKDDPTEPPKDDPTEPPKDDPTEPPKDDPTEAPKDDPTEAPKDDPTPEPGSEGKEVPLPPIYFEFYDDEEFEGVEVFVGDEIEVPYFLSPEKEAEVGEKALEVEWKSADEAIAVVDEDGMITALAAGEVEITVELSDGTAAAFPLIVKEKEGEKKPEEPEVPEGETPEEPVLPDVYFAFAQEEGFEHYAAVVGDAFEAAYTLSPEKAGGAESLEATWTSTNEEVATVSDVGLVNALAAGEAEISVELSDGSAASFPMVVTAPAEEPEPAPAPTPAMLSLDMESTLLELVEGTTFAIPFTVTPAVKPVEEPVEEPAEEPGEAPAEEPAEEPGEAPVEEPTGEPAVEPAEEPGEVPMEQPAEEEAKETVLWTSSDKSVATVDETGLITALKPGEIFITGELQSTGQTIYIFLEVVSSKPHLKMFVSDLVDLTPMVPMESYNYTSDLIWKSSNTKAVTVEQDGLAYAKDIGVSMVTASVKGVKAPVFQIEITVQRKMMLMASGNTGAVKWDYTGTTLTIKGSGRMADYSATNAPWKEYAGQITSIVIENGVSIIGMNAFNGCTAVTSVSFPATSLTNISPYAFYGCTALPKVVIPSSITALDQRVFEGCTALTSVTIPNSVKTIGSRAFARCTSLARIDLEDVITAMDPEVFAGCTSLTTVEIPTSMTALSNGLFSGCTALKGIVVPPNIKTIGNSVFENCTALTGLTINEGVTRLGNYVFRGCTALGNPYLPNTVTSIGVGVYQNCTGLKGMTANRITSLPADTFNGCTSLVSYYISTNDTKSIGARAFQNCTTMKEIKIPDSVASIGESAFQGCTALNSVNLPKGLTQLSKQLFAYCSALESLSIPGTVTAIADSTFLNSGLKSVTFPAALRSIGNNAFEGCNSLTSLSVPNTVTTIGNYAFASCSALKIAYLPTGLKEIPTGLFANDVALSNFGLVNGVTTIGADAFYNCKALAIMNMPASVTTLGARAFMGCSSLSSLTFSNGITTLPDSVFSDCVNLRRISLPENLVTIGPSAFSGCTGLGTGIVIPASVTGIGHRAFYGIKFAKVAFMGNAPWMDTEVFTSTAQFKAMNGRSGFTSPWYNRTPVKFVTDPTGFITRLYTYVMSRNPDPGSVPWYLYDLLILEESGANITKFFFHSKEWNLKNSSNAKYVDTLYIACMGRRSDKQGFDFWMNYLNNGVTRDAVLNDMMKSREFKDICASYGIPVGSMNLTAPRDQNLEVTTFVFRLYDVFMYRNPDNDPTDDGINFWCAMLLNGMPAKAVVHGFVYGPEFKLRRKTMTDEDYIQRMYIGITGRWGTPSDVAYYKDKIAKGEDDLFNNFTDSPEFTLLCQRYNVKPR